jgi:hypothetical protein
MRRPYQRHGCAVSFLTSTALQNVCFYLTLVFSCRDPQIQIPFVEALYDGGPFLRSIPNALGDTGILVAQVGEAADLGDAAEHLTLNKNRANFLRSLTDFRFEGVRSYREVRGSTVPCLTLIGETFCKSQHFIHLRSF